MHLTEPPPKIKVSNSTGSCFAETMQGLSHLLRQRLNKNNCSLLWIQERSKPRHLTEQNKKKKEREQKEARDVPYTVIHSPRSHVFEGIPGKYVPLRIWKELEWYYYIILSKPANLAVLRSH